MYPMFSEIGSGYYNDRGEDILDVQVRQESLEKAISEDLKNPETGAFNHIRDLIKEAKANGLLSEVIMWDLRRHPKSTIDMINAAEEEIETDAENRSNAKILPKM